MNTLAKLSLAATAIAFGTSTTLAQTTVSITSDKDTTLYEDANGALANGGGDSVFCGVVGFNGGFGKRRALIHFDVAGQLPAGARILSAELDLFVAQSVAFLPIPTMAHRVTQDWSEGSVIAPGGGGAGGASAAGETTWVHTNYPGATWTNPGGDFVATPSFTFDLAAIGPATAGIDSGMVADLQAWLDNPTSNFGWLLKTDELVPSTARRMYSREFGSSPPTLRITYLSPGETGTYGTGWPVNGSPFQLDVTGTANGGATLPITYNNAPSPSVGANFFTLELDPVGAPLLPGNLLYLPIASVIPGDAFLTAGGAGATLFTVPAGFPGYLIVVQAAVLDSNPLGFSLSNAGVMLTQ
ncbi:MAG: DNRLRE domain-containing protein [Planctomycetes bacterium]|nr:DNRLRE domain-containing protein [Planctomycetota bacterium]